MRMPKNTSKRAHDNPLEFLAAAMSMGSSGAIEHQESVGQRDLCHSDSLPSDMREGCREALESIGAKFGDIDPSDPIFIPCTLPLGWTKKGTDHAMWSHLLDDKGRKRGSIFYKAAFYDRSAHMNMECRYRIRQDYENQEACVYGVFDGETLIHACEPVQYGDKRWESSDSARNVAKSWLDEKFPDWTSPVAYWD